MHEGLPCRELASKSGRLSITQIPALKDNYIYLLHARNTGETAVVDPAMAEPVLAVLRQKNWRLTHLFNTHHHGDHTGGNKELKEATGCKIYGFKDDAARIPLIDRELSEDEIFEWGGTQIEILFLPGHTLGHIAYHFPREKLLFSGDVLFLMGCGRLFEGTPEQAFASLNRIKKLPDETQIFCTHEYTQHNGNFALTVEPGNKALQQRMEEVNRKRRAGQFTVPDRLAAEKSTNPFLRTDSPEIRKNLGMEQAEDVEVFAALREKRNHF